MTAAAKAYASLALLGLGIAAFFGFRNYERAYGKLQYVVQDDVRTIATQNSVIASANARLRVDTVMLTRLLHTTDTALMLRVDTAIVHHVDSVFVPVRVLVQADSAVQACRNTANDCAIYGRAEKARGDAFAAEVAALTKAQSGWLARCGLSAGYAAVFSAGALRAGPGVLAGCRVIP